MKKTMNRQERIDKLMGMFDGRQLTGKISEEPEQWLTLMAFEKTNKGYLLVNTIDTNRYTIDTTITNDTNLNNNTINNTTLINNTISTKLKDNNTMDNILDIKKYTEEKRKALDTTPPTGGDWLTSLPVGTLFLCRMKGKPFLDEYHVIDKTDKAVKLHTNLNEPEIYIWVEAIPFCQFYELVEILIKKDEAQ